MRTNLIKLATEQDICPYVTKAGGHILKERPKQTNEFDSRSGRRKEQQKDLSTVFTLEEPLVLKRRKPSIATSCRKLKEGVQEETWHKVAIGKGWMESFAMVKLRFESQMRRKL
jgi:hypothetical protein